MKKSTKSRIKAIASAKYLRGTVAKTGPGGKNPKTSLASASRSTTRRVAG